MRYVLVRILIIPLKPFIILFNLICENLTHGYIFNLSKILQMLRFMSFFQRMYSDHFKDLGHKGLITYATNVINTKWIYFNFSVFCFLNSHYLHLCYMESTKSKYFVLILCFGKKIFNICCNDIFYLIFSKMIKFSFFHHF